MALATEREFNEVNDIMILCGLLNVKLVIMDSQ